MAAEQQYLDPGWYPAGLDASRGRITFRTTTAEALASSAFHDGRRPIDTQDGCISVPIEDALRWHSEAGERPALRLIAHTSFCCSTLLARLVSAGGGCLSYREPGILVELADLKAANHPLTRTPGEWRALVEFLFARFARPWGEAGFTVIKPSNRANGILDDLAGAGSLKLVRLSSDVRSYLCANLRGGEPRLRFSLNLLNQLCLLDPGLPAEVRRIEALGQPPLARTLCLLALCLHAQERILQRAATGRQSLALDKRQLQQRPRECLGRAMDALDLPPPDRIEAIGALLARDAKDDAGGRFSVDLEREREAWLERVYGGEIAAGCDWYQGLVDAAQPTRQRADSLLLAEMEAG